jgi:staphylococcal nuclease domain-containing protein 1
MANNVVILNPSSSQGPEVAGERKKSKIEIKKLPVVGLPPSPKEAPQPKPKKQKKPKAQPTQAPQAGGLGTEGKPKKTERPEPVERQIVMQAGIVKAVNSGDSLTILEIDEENPRNNGPKEIFLTILGLKAPIVGRREVLDGKIIPDEPFAWHSREFLRKLVIGKPVVYRIEHTVEERERERSYGELWAHDETDIRMEIVSHGWADVITKPRKNSAGFDIEPTLSQMKLEAAKEEAKEKKLGIWGNSKDAIRRVRYHDLFKDENSRLSNDELYQLYKAVKDKGPLKAVVENVRNGTTFNVLLTDTFDYFTLTLSGVRSPQLKPEQQAFAREAKYFAEHLLLNRDVTVTIDGLDKLSLYGSVLLNGSNIALTLLNHGLASFVEWTSKESSALSEKFKEAEKKAQENRLRMWSDYQPLAAPEGGKGSKQESKTQATKETSVTGKVIEIINAGTITVRVAKPDANNAQKTVDRIITFSSIRLPRGPIPARAKAREEKKDLNEEEAKAKKIEEETLKRENIYAAEAKEFLRHLLIGQRVRCVFDYPRASRTNDNDKAGPVKHYWSVYLTKGQQEKNVALELVQQGYAYVVEHGQDELRSADYKDLILAEKAAKASGKNLHSPPNKVPRHFINDLTLPPSEGEMTKEQKDKALKGLLEKCRHFLVGFTSKDKIEAIVDYVFSAGRYKLTLPNNNCTIMFALTGVILDKPFKEDVQPKPDISIFDKTYPLADKNGHPIWGNIALHYVRDNAYQRKVQISVKKLDSYGAFIGQLMIDGNDLGEQLIEKGYAKIHLPSLRKAPYLAKYRTAYENARKAKIGLWEHFDFEEEAKKDSRSSRPQK